MPHRSIVDVMLILTRPTDGHVLLALRENTGYADGMWNLPSGKLEADEHAVDALRREAAEEIGIRLHPDELVHVGTVHCRNPEGEARLGLFFTAPCDPERQGEPYNAEPHKCAKLDWFPLDMTPHNTVPYTTAGLHLAQEPATFARLGWDEPAW